MAFTRAHVPSGSLAYTPISYSQWRASLKRFRPRAARGVDGYSHRDLLHLDESRTSDLLAMLTDIETNGADWPEQLLEGLVIAVAKVTEAEEVNQYRAIVLLSIIYRCWLSLRSCQILQWLQHIVPEDEYGFIPGREPAQLWLMLQGLIEYSLQQGTSLGGISCDVAKAFNCIRRQPLFELAVYVGIPVEITGPWSRFLASFRRSFTVLNQAGSPQLSDIGFPEGCALSVASMALLDFSMHLYQMKFTSRTRTMSFVDNICLFGADPTAIAMAFNALRTFLSMWGLTLDLAKTYCWGTHRSMRQGLAPLGFKTVFDASELGGSLSFTAAYRNRCLRQRGDHMDDKWARLRRSQSPLKLKLVSLPMAFWAKSLHGANGCPLSLSYFDGLRSQAMKALRLACAGANSLLRFALSEPLTADPAFYAFHRAVLDFRRICHKSPGLVDLWTSFAAHSDGHSLPGPFSVLGRWFSLVGWSCSKPLGLPTMIK